MTIPAGKHRPRWWWLRFLWPFGWVHLGRWRRKWMVNFDESCRYPLYLNALWGETYEHINKLCGWSTSFWPKKINGKWGLSNSIRIGWRPHPQLPGKVWLGLYLKQDGKRTTHDLGHYDYGENIALALEHRGKKVRATVWQDQLHKAQVEAEYLKPRGWGWRMGVYFGGTPTAPKAMKLTLDRR